MVPQEYSKLLLKHQPYKWDSPSFWPSCGSLELGSGFNPEFTGRENIFLNSYILGLKQKEILERYEQIVEFADIGDFINQPVKTYSSGMFVRLAFAVQAHVDASVVIIDEALAVGDVFFRQKCYARLEQLRNSGTAILLVSHSMTDIEQYCERALLLNKEQSVLLVNLLRRLNVIIYFIKQQQQSSLKPQNKLMKTLINLQKILFYPVNAL